MTSKQKKGIIIMAVGLILLLNSTSLFQINIWGIVFKYWPLLLIYKAIKEFYEHNNWSSGNYILLGIGIVFLGKNLGFLDFLKFSYIWPIIIIIIGFNMLQSKGSDSFSKKNDFSTTAIFSGVEMRNTSKDFQKSSILALFGGCNVDLKLAEMASNDMSEIDVTVLFGGAEILLPKDWNVEVKGMPLLGGISNETYFSESNKKTLVINAFVMFGGLDIKN
jgi:predicted membrane protein